MSDMSRQVLKWAGGALFVVAAVGMAVYFAVVGLDKADKLASVVGAFLGLAGLALAIYGIVADRRERGPLLPQPTGGEESAAVQNRIVDGTFHGPVIQGRDISQVSFGSPPYVTATPQDPPAVSPPAPPEDSAVG